MTCVPPGQIAYGFLWLSFSSLFFFLSFFFSTISSLPFYQAQDPAAFGEEFANKARKALQTRYRLLPFLYTLFYEAQMDGSTVVRPVMHE